MRKLLTVLAAAAALTFVAPAATKDILPLHVGSSGPAVCGVKWMISGAHSHRPNVFTVEGTFTGKQCSTDRSAGYLGKTAGAAIFAYKYRLGWPAKWNVKSHPIAGAYFLAILRGTKTRPIAWVALAQQRVQLVATGGATKLALRIKAWEVSQLGHAETNSSNCGPAINGYFTYLHLPCGLQWCEIFQANGFGHGGYRPVPFALGATSPYGVIATEQWAQAHHYLSAIAHVGSLVAFLDDGGHIGYVVKVAASGYVTIEGNSDDRVQQVWHPWNDRLRVFIDLPNLVA